MRGGIFADETGLGKTLTLLSLIARNKPKCGVPKTTLIVCPECVLSTWMTQLEKHTRPGSLKAEIYKGEETQKAYQLLEYDIVITTYRTLSPDIQHVNMKAVKAVEWWRVIFDDAHVIKDFNDSQTRACIDLKAHRRWVITGKPIQNYSSDLVSLMAPLRFAPFSIEGYWKNLIQRPLDQGNESGMQRLKKLLGSISLRRITYASSRAKSLVGLPPKTIETCFVDILPEEREMYDLMEAEVRSELLETSNANPAMQIVRHMINRLRQICDGIVLSLDELKSEIRSLREYNALEVVTHNPELLNKLTEVIQDGDICPICLSLMDRIVITTCAHCFCRKCILTVVKPSEPSGACPVCRRSLSKSDIFVAPLSSEDKKKSCSPPLYSKVSVLLKMLLEIKERQPYRKSVVFSEFSRVLDLMEELLRAAGVTVVILKVSLKREEILEVIREFSDTGPSAPTVLLISMPAVYKSLLLTKINLTMASMVYLLEPWWRLGRDETAMDMVHQIGQKEEVSVVRLIVKDSIEERLLQLVHEMKNKLASGSFKDAWSREDYDETELGEIRSIMHL